MAAVLVSPTRACFDALYGPSNSHPRYARYDPVLTIEQPPRVISAGIRYISSRAIRSSYWHAFHSRGSAQSGGQPEGHGQRYPLEFRQRVLANDNTRVTTGPANVHQAADVFGDACGKPNIASGSVLLSASSRNSAPFRRKCLFNPEDKPLNVTFVLSRSALFLNMRRSPRKRASTALVAEKSITIRFLVDSAALNAASILSILLLVAAPQIFRLTVSSS